MFKYRNPNPCKEIVGDCVVRALSILLGQSWDDTYDDLSFKAKMMHKIDELQRRVQQM